MRMQMIQRIRRDPTYRPRVLFIMGGMFLLLQGAMSSYMYARGDTNDVEKTRLKNQGILTCCYAVLQLTGGLISLFFYIDYGSYKPFVSCFVWNAWVLLHIILHLYNVLEYVKEWFSLMPHVTVYSQIFVVIVLELYEHWILYKDSKQTSSKRKSQ